MEDANKRRDEFLFVLLNLNAVPKKSTPEKSIYIWHFQWIAINATKFEETRIHFKSEVSAAVTVVVAKAPYCYLYNGKEARQVAPCKGTQDSVGI